MQSIGQLNWNTEGLCRPHERLMRKNVTEKRCVSSMGQVKKVSKYDQEMTQSHSVDQPRAPQGRDTERQQLNNQF